MARPLYEPTPAETRQVEAMAGYGIPEQDIAAVLRIAPKTLRKHFRRERGYRAHQGERKSCRKPFSKSDRTWKRGGDCGNFLAQGPCGMERAEARR
jgi:hypothetical protein